VDHDPAVDLPPKIVGQRVIGHAHADELGVAALGWDDAGGERGGVCGHRLEGAVGMPELVAGLVEHPPVAPVHELAVLDGTPVGDADWSPDGRTIAFSRLASPDRPLAEATLYLADANGTNVRQLGPAPVRGVSPSWSPDGKRLAFVSFADGNDPPCDAASCPPSGELYVVRADGSGLTRLTRSRADDEHPSWSPDGRRLAYSSGFSQRRQGHLRWLMVMPANGGRAVRVGRFAGVLDPSWSPAGVR